MTLGSVVRYGPGSVLWTPSVPVLRPSAWSESTLLALVEVLAAAVFSGWEGVSGCFRGTKRPSAVRYGQVRPSEGPTSLLATAWRTSDRGHCEGEGDGR